MCSEKVLVDLGQRLHDRKVGKRARSRAGLSAVQVQVPLQCTVLMKVKKNNFKELLSNMLADFYANATPMILQLLLQCGLKLE